MDYNGFVVFFLFILFCGYFGLFLVLLYTKSRLCCFHRYASTKCDQNNRNAAPSTRCESDNRNQHHLFKLDRKTNKRTMKASSFYQRVGSLLLFFVKRPAHTKQRNGKQDCLSLQIKVIFKWIFLPFQMIINIANRVSLIKAGLKSLKFKLIGMTRHLTDPPDFARSLARSLSPHLYFSIFAGFLSGRFCAKSCNELACERNEELCAVWPDVSVLHCER